MKLVFVISSLDMGGAQRVAVNLIQEWCKRGWAIKLVVTYSGRGTSYYDIPEGVEVVYLADLVRSWRGGYLLDQLRRTLSLRLLLKESRPNRVISFLTDANLFTLAASRGLGVPVVVSERNYPPSDVIPWLHAKARLLLYPYATRVVIQTRRGLEWVAREIPSARAMAVPNPIALPLPAAHPTLEPSALIDAEARLILAAGRLVHEKGFDVLIDGFARSAAQQPGWQLAIVGEGPERAALEHQIISLQQVGRIHLVGAAGNIGDWYERADIFVLASRYEGFPNALLEAMAHGCAAISFNCDTGPADIIVAGENGLLLGPSPDADTLAQALTVLMTDEQLRQSLADAARAVSDRFSMNSVLKQWDIVLDIAQAEEEPA